MQSAKNLTEAIEALRRDPSQPVEADVEGLHVELRVRPRRSAADAFREVGHWEGETAEELAARLDAARKAGGTAEPPAF